MSKLIDAEKLDFVSYQGIPNGYKDSFDSGVLYAMNLIDEQPTVDAVPVVRCRDCKHKRMVMKSGCLGCDIQCCLHPYDWYCPDGEKVTE